MFSAAAWINLAISLFVIVALIDGFIRGFFLQIVELAAFIAAIILGLEWYRPLANWLIDATNLSAFVAKPMAFVGLWFVSDLALSLVLRCIYRRLPHLVRASLWNRILGLVPAFLKSVAYIGFALTVILSLPFGAGIKAPIEQSVLATSIVSRTNFLVHALERSLGGSIAQTFNFLTTTGEHEVPQGLSPVPADRLRVEAALEDRMLTLVNGERTRIGWRPLVMDDRLRAVARAHSTDMWIRGYFDHVNPDGQDPFARMVAAGIHFVSAGENLALAPSIDIAHFGLMRSPEHRDNILHADFARVGIGVVSAGVDGLMVTQDFTDASGAE